MTRRFLLVLCLLFPLLSHTAFADDASKRAKTHDLFALLHLDALMQQVMTQAMDASQQAVNGVFGEQKISDIDRPIVDSYLAQVKSICLSTLSWKELEPAYTSLYVETYTEEEIDGMLAFYRSPIGQSMLSKMPELTRRSTALVQTRLPVLQEQLRSATQDFQARLSKAHEAQPARKARS